MKVKVQKDDFSQFLLPVSRITDNSISCAVHIEKDHLYIVAHDTAAVCIYYAKHKPLEMDKVEPFTIHVSDIRKIINAIDTIDDEEITLNIDEKSISYNSSTIKFKCYLLDAAVAASEKISAKMIDAFSFDTEFVILSNKFASINKGCAFTENKGKIYFYTNSENNYVYVDIDDKAANYSVNNITFVASEGFNGQELTPTSPLSIDTFKIISALKHDVLTRINKTKGAYMFSYQDGNNEIKYLLRALTF